MVTEIKSKCYTCLDPIAPADPTDSADLTCCQGSDLYHQNCSPTKLDHRSSTHKQSETNIHEANKGTIRINTPSNKMVWKLIYTLLQARSREKAL